MIIRFLKQQKALQTITLSIIDVEDTMDGMGNVAVDIAAMGITSITIIIVEKV